MADVVRGQIAYPEKPMPANLVDGSDADDVAVYIALCAANPTCGVKASTTTPQTTTTAPTTTTSSGGGSPTALGKQVFTTAGCAGCHTLKDAGATGNVGPNLDQLKPSAATVSHQVQVGGGAMPSFKGTLSPAQIAAVAAYVSSVAGK
jgi:sulfite dehydrogenase